MGIFHLHQYNMATIDKAFGEYKQLLSDLKNEDATKETIYEQLMAKEDNVLNLIGRVVDQKNTDLFKDSVFYNNSLFDILMKFANTWKAIMQEIFVEKRNLPSEFRGIFYSGDRKIYVGMMLVLVALVLFFIGSSS